MVRLNGQYYHVDVTWDDPIINGSDRPDKVSHQYFLFSEDFNITNDGKMISDGQEFKTHYGYNTWYNAEDTKYDSYSNLHGNSNPIFYVNGKWYVLYTSDNKGIIAAYNPINDTYTNLYTISDRWSAGGSGFWKGNYSNIAEYDGILYFNTEYDVYQYDPSTKTANKYLNYIGGQLYGLYIKDGVLYGLTAASPNYTPTSVELGKCEEIADTYTVTAYNSVGWNNMYIYYWGSESKEVTWPGELMYCSYDDEFICLIPADAKGIIFNNGNGLQTVDIKTGIQDGAKWVVYGNNSVSTVNDYYLVGTMNDWTTNDTMNGIHFE